MNPRDAHCLNERLHTAGVVEHLITRACYEDEHVVLESPESRKYEKVLRQEYVKVYRRHKVDIVIRTRGPKKPLMLNTVPLRPLILQKIIALLVE